MSEPNQFESDKIAVRVEPKPNCLVSFHVQVTPATTKATYQQAVKSVNRATSLPGFRKGRAPDSLVIKHYSQPIEQEWKNLLLSQTLPEALKLAGMQHGSHASPLTPKLKRCEIEGGAEYVYTFEREPDVPLVDPTSFQLVSKEVAPVTQAQLDGEVRTFLYSVADWQEVKGRAVEEGDYVDIDVELLEPQPQVICRDSRFQVLPGLMPAWMRTLLIGGHEGESLEGVSERDEEMMGELTHETFLATPCRVTIKGIYATQLPELTDELAQKFGADHREDLLEKVRKRQEAAAEMEVQADLMQQVADQLLEKYPFEVPQSVIEFYSLVKERNLLRSLLHEKDSEELRNLKKGEARQQAKNFSEKWVRLIYAAGLYGKRQGIQVTQGELYAEWVLQSKGGRPPLEMSIDSAMSPELIQQSLYTSILTTKALKAMLEEALPKSESVVPVEEKT